MNLYESICNNKYGDILRYLEGGGSPLWTHPTYKMNSLTKATESNNIDALSMLLQSFCDVKIYKGVEASTISLPVTD